MGTSQKRRISFFVSIPLLFASYLMTACKDSQSRSMPRLMPAPSDLISFTIEGPGEVAPGSSATFRATLRNFRDQSVRDMSQDARWSSSNPQALTIEGGLATGRATGDATITAHLENYRPASRPLIIVPAGTYLLHGTISDTDNCAPTQAAQVQETGVGLATTTGADGGYRLYGVPSSAMIRVTKEGFQPSVVTTRLTSHATLNILLRRPAASPDCSDAGLYDDY